MAIARKPKASTGAPAHSEHEIEALINKGGSVADLCDRQGSGTPKTTNVVLRLPPEMLERVDQAVGHRALRIPRHTWLLEAILEKLNREQSL